MKIKALNMVEQILCNKIMFRKSDYKVVEHYVGNNNTYTIENLKVDLEDNILWFSDERFGFNINELKDIIIRETGFQIIVNDTNYFTFEFIK